LERASVLYRKAGNKELADAIIQLSAALKKADNQEAAALSTTLRKFQEFK